MFYVSLLMKAHHLIIVLLAIVSVKLLLNLAKYFRCKRYLSLYFDWLDEKKKVGWKLTEKKPQVMQLFKDSGIGDSFRPHAEPIGYGLIQPAALSVHSNFPSNRKDMVNITVSMFHQAIGTFNARAIEAINPLYWIETIIMLPRAALTYVGIKPEHVSVKILQLTYWIAGVTITALYGFFKPELYDSIGKIINRP